MTILLVQKYNISAPTWYYPCDNILDPSQTASNPTLVPGVKSMAWSFDGATQYVNLGNHRGSCFGNLDLCTNGITISAWMNFGDNFGYYLCNGAQSSGSFGFSFHHLINNQNLEAWFKKSNGRFWKVGVPMATVTRHVWYHMTVTWSEDNGASLYMNGCLRDQQTTFSGSAATYTPSAFFSIGSPNDGFASANLKAEFLMDELSVWDQELSEISVWFLYVQS